MFCPYCGKELKDEAPFCGFCGKPLKKGKDSNAPAKKETVPLNRAERKAEPKKQTANSQHAESRQEPARIEKRAKKKRASPLIAVLIVILLLLLAAATLAFLIYSGRVDASRIPFVGEKLESLLTKNGTDAEKEETDSTLEPSSEPTPEPTPEPPTEPISEDKTEPTPVPKTDAPKTDVPMTEAPKADLPASNATDEITNYEITVEVNDDGTVNLEYHIDWKILKSDEIGPLQWVTIGIPNSNYVRFEKLTDTIKDISYSDVDNGLRIKCDKAYYADETFSFGFLLVQDDMYQKDLLRDGETTYTFTPGQFDEIAVDNLTVRWSNTDVISSSPDSRAVGDYNVWNTTLEPGESYTITVNYPNDARSFKSESKPIDPLTASPYIGSLQGWIENHFSSAAASSEIHYQGKVYGASNAIDGRMDTSWQEDGDDYGIGEYLVAFFDGPKTVQLLGFRLGYSTSYERNARPKTLKLTFSDGTELICNFEDINETVYLELNYPIETNFIRYTIMDIYPGSEYTDTCISEVSTYY